MLTVMYRNEKGHETIYPEVRMVEKITAESRAAMTLMRDEPTEGFRPGVLCHLNNDPIGYVHFGVRDQAQAGDPADPVVFVMNEQGKTVARYPL